MTSNLVTEIASILDDFDRALITETERDEAISAIAARSRRSRITEIAVNAVDQDAA